MSPIEQALLDAMPDDLRRQVAVQYPVGFYRVDFAFPYSKVAVECDGHRWHSTTKAQASDAKRDRDLSGMGWRVIRFAGTEIYNNSTSVIAEIRACLEPGSKARAMLDSERWKCSKSATPKKQATFRDLIKGHVAIWRATVTKHEWASDVYNYIDLNSGPGKCPKDDCDAICHDGSPVIAESVLRSASVRRRLFLFERDDETRMMLVAATSVWPYTYIGEAGALVDIPRDDGRTPYGFIYADPSNADAQWNILAQYANRYKQVDIAINIACANIKRLRHLSYPSLREHLALIAKKHWAVTDPHGRHQWTMLTGTNFPSGKTFGPGFSDIDKDKGREIYERVVYTASELAEMEES
jgi:very-short-patch-repair endonuclease